jgi:hypothetical protein
MRDLAVIIVTWNVRELIIDALRTLLEDLSSSGLQAQVVVVDSASHDGTPAAVRQHFPQVDLIACEDNPGFATANNRALRQLGFGQSGIDLPCAVFLLNPDTLTRPGAVRSLYDALMSDPQVGLVGARLTYGDGTFQHSAFRFPGLRQLWVEFFPTPGRLIEGTFNGRYPRHLYAGREPFPVDCVLGATMLLRREVIEQTGLFDEQFFMYCEEIDWAWRIREAGWEVLCVPTAHIVHLAGQSTAQVRPQSIINLWQSRLRLFRKHYAPLKFILARVMIVVGMTLKLRQAARQPGLEPQSRQLLIDAYHRVRQMALGQI